MEQIAWCIVVLCFAIPTYIGWKIAESFFHDRKMSRRDIQKLAALENRVSTLEEEILGMQHFIDPFSRGVSND